MAKTKEQRLREVHDKALLEFDRVQKAQRPDRLQALQDRRFYSVTGAQWEGELEAQFENRPRYELNKVHLSIIRVVNEYRANRITVDFTPADGSEDAMADTCDGLYRADEQRCTANEAYDNAFEEGASGGYGGWRLRACYEDEDDQDNDKQRVLIEPIFDADSCLFFDLDAKRQDKADAKRAWLLVPQTLQGYIDEWDDDPASWPKEISQTYFDWATPDVVYVAEYYEVEETSELVLYFRGLVEDEPDMRVPQAELDAEEGKEDELKARGFRLVRKKREKTRQVHKYLMSGSRILEDCGFLVGKCIPLVPYYGKRWVIDGVERAMGHVRLAKDAQRLQNMLVSWLGEICARFDLEKPILTPQQVQGLAHMWTSDNIDRNAYLLLNPVTDAGGQEQPIGPLNYTKAPGVPPAMAAMFQIAETGLQEVLGNQQAGEQIQPNLSGKAVELIQNRLDMQVFIYMSNFAKAMKRSGEVWLSMMKELIVEKDRRMKTVDANGKAGSVVMNQPQLDDDGDQVLGNSLSDCSYEVFVDVGPSSSSRRAATVRALTGMLQLTQDPQTQQVLSGLALMNLEGEGIGDARDYFRKNLVQMGVIKPTDEEAQQMAAQAQGQQPDPQSQYLLAAAEEAGAKAAQNRASTVKTITDAELNRAKTAQTLASIGVDQNDQQLRTVQALQGALNAPQAPAPVLPIGLPPQVPAGPPGSP